MAVEIAQAYVSLIPSAKGFGAAVAKELGGVGDIGGKAGEEASKGFASRFTGGLGGIAAGLGAAFAGVKIGGFLKDAVGQASDLGESVSKVNVVFGDSAKQINDWSKTAATSLGQSQQQALEAAGTFGNLFRAMGITTDVAAQMSTKTIELAGDLASFNNANPEDVLVALKAGLVGETEPLRAFGVNLNEARIKAEALRLGLVKSTVDQAAFSSAQETADKASRKVADALKKNGEGSQQYADAVRDAEQANAGLEKVLGGKMPATLDAATKAQAAYSLIMADTTLAQGDFARTSGGLANQSRILAAQFKDLKAKVGSALLPAVTAVVTTITKNLIPAFDRISAAVAPVFREIVGGFRAMAAAFKAGGNDITSSGFAGFLERIGSTARKVFDEIKFGWKAAIAVFRGQESADAVGGFAGVMAQLAATVRRVVDAIRASWPTVKTIIASAIAGATVAIGFLVAHFDDIIRVAKLLGPPLLAAFAAFKAFSKVQAAVKSVQSLFVSFKAFSGLLLANPIGLAVAAVAALGVAFFLAYKKSKTFHDAVQPIVKGVVQAFKSLAGFVVTTVIPALVEFGKWLGPKLVAAGQGIGRFFVGTILPALKTVGAFITGTVVPALVEFGRWLGPKLLAAGQGLGRFFTGVIIPALKTVGAFIVGTIIPALARFAEWIGPKLAVAVQIYAKVFVAVWGTVFKVLSAVAGFVISKVVPAIISLAGWLGPKLVAGAKAVGGFITGVLVPAFQAVAGFITGSVIPAVRSFIDWFGVKVLPVIANVAGLVKDVLAVAFRVVGDIITGVVVPVLQALWAVFSGVILPILKEVAGFIIDVVVVAFKAWWAVISNVVLPIFDALWHIFTDLILPILKDVAKFIVETALVAFDNIVTLLRDKVIPAFSEMWAFINEKVIPVFAAVVGAIATFVVGAAQKIAGFVGDVKTKIDEFLGFFTGLGEKVGNAISGVASKVFGLGVDIVQGIIDGIKSMAEKLATEVGNFIDDNVPGPVKKVLGIASPSKVMYGFGENAAQGLTDGILAGQPALVDAATTLGQSVADATGAALSPMAAELQRFWTAPDGAKLKLTSDKFKPAAAQQTNPGPIVSASRGFSAAAEPSAPLATLAKQGAVAGSAGAAQTVQTFNIGKVVTQEQSRTLFDELAWRAASGVI